MRIGIVNDTASAVEALKRTVAFAGHEVAWVANNGERGVEKCCADTPDLVLMDLIMPVMNGVKATRNIMLQCPCSILLVADSIESNSSKVFEAMGAGALDVVPTPELESTGNTKNAELLIAKIAVIMKLHGNGVKNSTRPRVTTIRERVIPPLLAIGSSTGGPSALATLLGKLPADFPAAVAVVQHVDGQFSNNLVQWLDSQTDLKVSLARSGDPLKAGEVVVAPGNNHMIMGPGGMVQITMGHESSLYVPSVDIFFESLCCAGFPPGSTAVLLTGMGADGARGMLELKKSGWMTIAQDRESSVVWGMPGAAVKMGAVREVCSITDMPGMLVRYFNKKFQEKKL